MEHYIAPLSAGMTRRSTARARGAAPHLFAYREANEPKELYVVPNAVHIDLYDDTSKIPFDKIGSFLKSALNG